jgi:hypothetical protein
VFELVNAFTVVGHLVAIATCALAMAKVREKTTDWPLVLVLAALIATAAFGLTYEVLMWLAPRDDGFVVKDFMRYERFGAAAIYAVLVCRWIHKAKNTIRSQSELAPPN